MEKRTLQAVHGHKEVVLGNRVNQKGLWEIGFIIGVGWGLVSLRRL